MSSLTAWNLLPQNSREALGLTGGAAILARARVLFSTRCGESALNPRWGTRLFELAGRSADPLTASLARAILMRDLARCLPELELLDPILRPIAPASIAIQLRLRQADCEAILDFSLDLNRALTDFSPRVA